MAAGYTPFSVGPRAYVASPCVEADLATPRLTTDAGIEYVRTPDERFIDLPGYTYAPNYATVEGMRMHYVDAGPIDASETLLLLHGQPTWSYLYRKMIPVFAARGYRVIAPDAIGMGRSDKPISLLEHTYAKHVARVKAFIRAVLPAALDAPLITLFVQDWGSMFGLRTWSDEPDWFRRVICANGALPSFSPGPNPFAPLIVDEVNYNCDDGRIFIEMGFERAASAPCSREDDRCFTIWANYCLTNPTFQARDVLSQVVLVYLSPEEKAAYNAPFPTRTHMAAPRSWPSMIAGIDEPGFGTDAAIARLGNFTRPVLCIAGHRDRGPGNPVQQQRCISWSPGAQAHTFEHKRFQRAGHFLQEDEGAAVAEYVADFIDATPVDPPTPTPTAAPTAAPTSTPTSTPTPAPTEPPTATGDGGNGGGGLVPGAIAGIAVGAAALLGVLGFATWRLQRGRAGVAKSGADC